MPVFWPCFDDGHGNGTHLFDLSIMSAKSSRVLNRKSILANTHKTVLYLLSPCVSLHVGPNGLCTFVGIVPIFDEFEVDKRVRQRVCAVC